MPQKRTDREKVTVRIDPSILIEARKIARRDYGNESRISPVVEDALTKYVASELDEGTIKAILSATEGAIYDRIARKIEKEIDGYIDRTGNLIASQSYESTLATLMLEDWFFSSRSNAKEKYEDMRSTAAQRLRNRFKKNGADPGGVDQSDQTKSLEEENQKLREEIEALRGRNEEISERLREIIDQANERTNLTNDYVRWANEAINYLIENHTITKSNKKLFQEYIDSHPKPTERR